VSKKKKQSATKTRAKSASRRKTASRPRRGAVKRTASTAPAKIQLKPIKVLIGRAIAGLQRLPPSDAYNLTIERLQRCEMEFNSICNPLDPDGCGPNMEFPREAVATSRS
jgi:hypothetical protein